MTPPNTRPGQPSHRGRRHAPYQRPRNDGDVPGGEYAAWHGRGQQVAEPVRIRAPGNCKGGKAMTMRDRIAAVIATSDMHNDSFRDIADAIIAALPGMVPGWQPISTAPRDDTRFLAWCPPCPKFPDGRMMIWSGRILFGAMGHPIPNHLQYPATMWHPLVPPLVPA